MATIFTEELEGPCSSQHTLVLWLAVVSNNTALFYTQNHEGQKQTTVEEP